jgi:hypothetical protein
MNKEEIRSQTDRTSGRTISPLPWPFPPPWAFLSASNPPARMAVAYIRTSQALTMRTSAPPRARAVQLIDEDRVMKAALGVKSCSWREREREREKEKEREREREIKHLRFQKL